jgi:hypothetical protein
VYKELILPARARADRISKSAQSGGGYKCGRKIFQMGFKKFESGWEKFGNRVGQISGIG